MQRLSNESSYNLKKYTNPVKGWRPRILKISLDEFSYLKDKEEKPNKIYHITNILKSFIEKKEDKNTLNLIIYPKEELMFEIEPGKELEIYKIKNKLNALKIIFYVNRLRYLYDKNPSNQIISKEKCETIKKYTTSLLYDELLCISQKNDSKIQKSVDKFRNDYNELVGKINQIFVNKHENNVVELVCENDLIFRHNNEDNEKIKNLFDFSTIEKLHLYYNKLITIFIDIKKKEILTKYYLKPVIEIQLTDKQFEEKKKKLIEEGTSLKNRLLTLLNRNSTLKEKFKKILKAKNYKLYFCPQCNNLLQKTNKTDSNCHFDTDCTGKSLFYCRKCRINYCTVCVVYHRNLKCYRNHTYFPNHLSSENNREFNCFLCDSKEDFPFYSCEHCKEDICNKCVGGKTGKTNTCFNCINELTWRKRVYCQCSKCYKWKDCFWCCILCDYLLCIDCYRMPKGYCGSFHEIKEINLDNERKNRVIEPIMFKNNYEMNFLGKCSKCNQTINSSIDENTKIYMCLRCKVFLCEKCNFDINS